MGDPTQQMQLSNGKQKGIRTILEERGLWRGDLNLQSARKPLSEQPDFKAQQCWLQKRLTM